MQDLVWARRPRQGKYRRLSQFLGRCDNSGKACALLELVGGINADPGSIWVNPLQGAHKRSPFSFSCSGIAGAERDLCRGFQSPMIRPCEMGTAAEENDIGF